MFLWNKERKVRKSTEGKVALRYVPYRAVVNAGGCTVPGRCGRITLGYVPYRAVVNAGECTVPGGCTSRSKSDPRESLEVYTKRDKSLDVGGSFSNVGPGFINSHNHESRNDALGVT